jgi:hypothetical protein
MTVDASKVAVDLRATVLTADVLSKRHHASQTVAPRGISARQLLS